VHPTPCCRRSCDDLIRCYAFHSWLCFAPFSPSGQSYRRWRRAAHAKLDESNCPNHPRIRHIHVTAHNCHIRRGRAITHNQLGPCIRKRRRDHPAAAAATQAAPPSRNRIANEPEATLLQHKHAPDPSGSCGFFDSLFMIPITGSRPVVPILSDSCDGKFGCDPQAGAGGGLLEQLTGPPLESVPALSWTPSPPHSRRDQPPRRRRTA
jgi:hypothetical protein